MIYRQIFSTSIANKSLKLSFTLKYVLMCADDLKNDFKLICCAFDLLQKFEAVSHEWKSLPNTLDTQQRYHKYLTNLVFSVHTVSYGSSFFFLRVMAHVLRAWAIIEGEKLSP